MKLRVRKSDLRGAIAVPGSKSHTIRAVAIASLAPGHSVIDGPLESADTLSCVAAYRGLGAKIHCGSDSWTVEGTGGVIIAPEQEIDVGNSGTTLHAAMGSAALLRTGKAVLTGDEQIRRRPAGALAKALTGLGASVVSKSANGCAPFEVYGTLRGGKVAIDCLTSQYLTSLLLATPLSAGSTELAVHHLNEAPYVTMTLDWVRRQGVRIDCEDDYSYFWIRGGQSFKPVNRRIPADFSSATFFLAAGAIGNNDVTCNGLSMRDTQGDKEVVAFLQGFGARTFRTDGSVRVSANALKGYEIDLNATPDALPMLAALACFAEGRTRLVNCPQARVKETDRISVMATELSKLGAKLKELKDGLQIERSDLTGATVDSHGDHRVAMTLAIAGTRASGETIVDNAECINVTYPGFVDALKSLGADLTVED